MHGRKKFLGSGQVSSQSRATAGAIQGKFQSLNIKRLFQEVDCAIPQCLYGLFTSAFPAESNDGRSRFPLGQCRQQRTRISAPVLQVQIQQDHIKALIA